MSASQHIHGECLCGGVKVEAKNVKPSIGACHCAQCRQWTSSPMQTVDCDTDVSFSGEENIEKYNSSDWAERGFCKRCGSTLFYRLKQTGQYFVAAGLFGDLPGFVFDHEVFIDEKPHFYSFANNRQQLTGEQVFAFFQNQDN
ncbi:MAG: GFA family protein [Nevskiales bacterium]